MQQSPFSKHLYVFVNKRRNRLKILFCMVENRLVKSIDGVGRTTSRVFDNNNNITEVTLAWADADTGPNESITKSAYDSLDRLSARADAFGTSAERATTYEYDEVGNLTAENRPDARITGFVYDAFNRQIQVTDADGFNSYLAYDRVGNQTYVRDRRELDTATSFDDLNRPLVP